MINHQLQSENIGDLVAALSKAQSEIESAKFDKRSHCHEYASYTSVREACRLPLSRNGLSVTHHLDIGDGKRILITQLSHSSGQWMRSYLAMPQERETPHGVGGAITYAKRYALSALICIDSDSDDDGEAAEAPYKKDFKKPELAVDNAPCLSPEQCEAIKKAVNGDYAFLNRIVKEHKKDCIEKVPSSQFDHIMNMINLREKTREKTGS